MQLIIQFIINVLNAFIDTCMNNYLLSWTIYLFVLSLVLYTFSTIWRRK